MNRRKFIKTTALSILGAALVVGRPMPDYSVTGTLAGGTFTIGNSQPIPWNATTEEANAILERSKSCWRFEKYRRGSGTITAKLPDGEFGYAALEV